MAVVIGLQPRENSGFGHIRLPWRLETIRITATAVPALGRFPVARRREGRQRGRSRLLHRRGDPIGRNAVARAKPALAVAHHRLFYFDALLMLPRAADGRRHDLSLPQLDDRSEGSR